MGKLAIAVVLVGAAALSVACAQLEGESSANSVKADLQECLITHGVEYSDVWNTYHVPTNEACKPEVLDFREEMLKRGNETAQRAFRDQFLVEWEWATIR